jgi:hypothetical protein
MPLPAAQSRIADNAFVIRVQATGQGSAEQPAVAPGSERAEGAFGIFGMMIAGLIILFAVVLLVMKYRRRL